MPSFNKVILMGHLTRDPELKYTPAGTPVCKIGLAVNHKYKSGEELKEEVCFIDVAVWGKQGENCNTYLQKGRLVLVEGRIQYQTWEDNNGQKHSRHQIVAESVKFLPQGKGKAENSGPEPEENIPF